jgi:hypothetical protein
MVSRAWDFLYIGLNIYRMQYDFFLCRQKKWFSMHNTGLKGPKGGTMSPLEIGSVCLVVRLFPAGLPAISLYLLTGPMAICHCYPGREHCR